MRKRTKTITCFLLILSIMLCAAAAPTNVHAAYQPVWKYSGTDIQSQYVGSLKKVTVQYRNPMSRDESRSRMTVSPSAFDISGSPAFYVGATFQDRSSGTLWGEAGYVAKVTAMTTQGFAYDWTDGPKVQGIQMVYRDRLYAKLTYYNKNNKKVSKSFQLKLKKKNKSTDNAAVIFGDDVRGGHGSYHLERSTYNLTRPQTTTYLTQTTHYEDKNGIFDSKKVKVEVRVVREFATRKLFGGANYVLQKVNSKTGALSKFTIAYPSKSVVLTRKEMWGK